MDNSSKKNDSLRFTETLASLNKLSGDQLIRGCCSQGCCKTGEEIQEDKQEEQHKTPSPR